MLLPLINILLAIANFIIFGILLRRLRRTKSKGTYCSPLGLRRRSSRPSQAPQPKLIEDTKTEKPTLPSSPIVTAVTSPVVVPDKAREGGIDKLIEALPSHPGEIPHPLQEETLIQKQQALAVWNIVGASVRGTGHTKNDMPCQDYHNYKLLDVQTVIAAVADGVGSASKAEEGAKLAVDTFLSAVKRVLEKKCPTTENEWIDVLVNGFQQARYALEQRAQTVGLKLREYGTTLMVTVIADNWLVTGQIGDGGGVALLEDNQLLTICPPQRGEYANQVFPLTTPDALQIAEFSAKRNVKVQAAALFTDGIQHLALNNADDSPHPPFFIPIFEELPKIDDCARASEQLKEYLASERINSRTDDDKTLLLIGRKSI